MATEQLCCRCGKAHATHEITVEEIDGDGCAIYRTCEVCASFVGAAVRGDPVFSRGEQRREATGAMRELLEGLERTRDN